MALQMISIAALLAAAWLNFSTQSVPAPDYPAAIAAYSAVLAKRPGSVPAALALADAYRHIHNYDEARRVLTRARKVHPRDAQLAKALGSLELEAQNWDAAIAAAQIAVRAAPQDLEARNYLGSAYRAKGDLALALAQFDRVLARTPASPSPNDQRALELAHYLRAQVYADTGREQKALADAETLFATRPNYLPGRELLAKILIRLEQCPRAVEILHSSEDSKKLETSFLFTLANAYECAGQPDRAEAARNRFAEASLADRTRAENETQSKHLVEQANELARQNKLSEALELTEQALAKNSRNGFAYAQQAKLYFSMHQFVRARSAIDQALALDPYQPDFLYVSGMLYSAAGDAPGALAAFERVSRINPGEADAYFEIGKIYLAQGNRSAARTALQRAVQLDPSEAEYARALQSTNQRP
jgi:tetratricopeptide (TPR) repeat protein